ncbi:putative regulator of g protein signaling superfamily [Diplodia seriata]|uniref:Putative regulator of g protein signaling superfamily n=1 Tax=Diplodia seriata TaxID=420778 RepID=A0A0G2E0R6_9PEZI|nr:putative regulator of g protein signaling superfamily [Diplodia seriata]
MSILFYRRPDFVSKSNGPLDRKECQRYVERTANGKRGIPEELSFENILTNKALPPCQLRDFMDYLVYVTHDAENLQFYLWLQDYTERFNALKADRKALSPEWKESEPTADEKAAQLVNASNPAGAKKKKRPGPLMPKVDFDKPADAAAIGLTDIIVSPKPEPSPTSMMLDRQDTLSPTRTTFGDRHGVPTVSLSGHSSQYGQPILSEESVREMADEANTGAGLKWQGFSVQPLRQEIDRVIAHYIAPGAPRELNLSARDRAAVLHALQHTTHPSAFKTVGEMVEATLRGQAHPNFVRWSICNGNKPRVFFVRTMGVTHIAAGLLIGLLLLLSSAPRWWRLFMFPVLYLGTTTMIAAYKGLCVILHKEHKRCLKPWEDADSIVSVDSDASGTTATSSNPPASEKRASTLAPHDASLSKKISTSTFATDYDEEATLHSNGGVSRAATPSMKRPYSMDTFGSRNTFDSEAWVVDYKRKSLKDKIWDQETWVQEESVRIIQDKIVRGAQLWSVMLTTAATVVFVAVPGACLY